MSNIKVYKPQGGDSLVVGDGGVLTIKSGGTFCMEVGSILCDTFPGGGAGDHFAMVYKSTDTVLGDSTLTQVVYDTVQEDPSSLFAAGAITIAETSVYIVNAFGSFLGTAVSNGYVLMELLLNGATVVSYAHANLIGVSYASTMISTMVNLTSTDVLTVNVQNETGASVTLQGSSLTAPLPGLQVVKVATV